MSHPNFNVSEKMEGSISVENQVKTHGLGNW